MIFERRAYTLRPGRRQFFWDAQEQWNTDAVFGPILSHNIGYFSALSGLADEVVHLYRFDSLDQWRSLYGDYYTAQSPDYFALVRPWMLQQRNEFLIPSPVSEFSACWTGPRWVTPPMGDTHLTWSECCVIETMVDLLPGGLPAYLRACRDHRVGVAADLAIGLLGELVTLVGRLHRVIRYELFASMADAQRQRETRDVDPRWQGFVAACRDWVAGEALTLLRPSPLPSRRAFLQAAEKDTGRPAPAHVPS